MSAAPVEAQQVPEPLAAQPVRAVLGPALGALCAVAVLGLPLGWLWSRLAPPELVMRSGRAATPGGVLPFAGQSVHRFDDMAVFLLLGLAAGVLTGAALWLLLRRRRGPLVLVAGVLGSLVAAWLAMRSGLWLAAARYPDLASTGLAFPRPGARVELGGDRAALRRRGRLLHGRGVEPYRGSEQLVSGIECHNTVSHSRVSCGWAARRIGSAEPALPAASARTPPPGPAGCAPGAAGRPGRIPPAKPAGLPG